MARNAIGAYSIQNLLKVSIGCNGSISGGIAQIGCRVLPDIHRAFVAPLHTSAAVQDAEDARVFADAVAGGPGLLVTAKRSDFVRVATATPWLSRDGVWLGGAVTLPGRLPLRIAHPRLAARWLRSVPPQLRPPVRAHAGADAASAVGRSDDGPARAAHGRGAPCG